MKIKISAQSTIEYVLLIAALVLAFIYAANRVIKPKTESMANTAGNIIQKASDELSTKMIGNTTNTTP